MTSTTAVGYPYLTTGTGDSASLLAASALFAGGAQDVFDNVIAPGLIPKVADAAGRAALYPSPEQGDRAFRQNVGYTETYFDVVSVANPGGRVTAGWYRTGDWIDTGFQSGAPTAATGWAVSGVTRFRSLNGWCYGSFSFSRTGGTLTVPADGDISNQTLGTAAQLDYMPSQTVLLGSGSGRMSSGTMTSAGLLTLTSTTPGASIVNGDVVGLAGVWPAN